jgi:hypothetical protein
VVILGYVSSLALFFVDVVMLTNVRPAGQVTSNKECLLFICYGLVGPEVGPGGT